MTHFDSSIPSLRSGHALLHDFSDPTKSILLGGFDEAGDGIANFDDIWLFNGSHWNQLSYSNQSQSPLPRLDFAGCLFNDNVFLFGGMIIDKYNSVSIYNDFWRFSISQQSWECLAEETNVPERYGHTVSYIDDGRILVHGGECMMLFDDLWLYEMDSQMWSFINMKEHSNKPCARSAHVSSFHNSSKQLFIFGGITKDMSDCDNVPEYLNDLWILNCSSKYSADWYWIQLEYTGLAPSPRDMPGFLLTDDDIFIFGGFGLIEIEDEQDEGLIENLTNRIDDIEIPDENVDDRMMLNQESNELQSSSEDGSSLLEENEGDDADLIDDDIEDEYDDIEITYLNDFWKINIRTKETTLLDSNNLVGRRGCKLLLNENRIVSFGGFDGKNYYSFDYLHNL